LATDVSPATVRHVNKDHITISPAKGYSVTVFNVEGDGNIEALVTANDGSETIRLLVAAPGKGRSLKIEKHEPTGIVNLIYKDIPRAKV
jgi:hypothetical protein